MNYFFAQLQEALGDRYQVVRELGSGGAATVYLATDLKHHRTVAVKVLHPNLAAGVVADRFLQEIEITAGLNHPNILSLFDSGADGDIVYFVMPYVEGESLQERLQREGALPSEEAIRIAGEVTDALSYAHEKGVIHRDIKPSNIMLSGSHAYLTDFGIARALEPLENGVTTATGIAVGTPYYMSPEQSYGAGDARSDLYSIGCVLYEMLAGEPPFQGPTRQSVLGKHAHDVPPLLAVCRPDLPPGLDQTIQQCMKKLPADRIQTARELADALKVAATGGDVDVLPFREKRGKGRRTAGADRPWYGFRGHWKGIPGVVGMGLLAAILLAAGWGVWALFQTGTLDPNRILVFPLGGSGLSATTSAASGTEGFTENDRYSGAGEDVATVVGFALEGSEPLIWLEAKDWMDPESIRDLSLLSLESKREIARRANAGYMIDGSVVPLGDSVTVILRLHDVARGTMLARSGKSAPGSRASVPQLGIQAIKSLLPPLLEPGRQADVLALDERDPAAIASWLFGERAYRQSRFDEALTAFERALAQDSALALAAASAAQVHSQLSQLDEAARFASAAARHEESLPQRYRHYVGALQDYFAGREDSADAQVEAALALKPDWAEAWVLRAEINSSLLRHPSFADSLAELAYRKANELDPELPDPLLHEAEVAARNGELARADSLANRYAALRGEPSSSSGGGREPDFLFRLRTELACNRQGPAEMDWESRVERNPGQVVLAGVQFLSVLRNSECAEAAFDAVLGAPDMAITDYWGSFLSLSNLLAEQGRFSELKERVGSDWSRQTFSGDRLFLLFGASGSPVDPEAEEVYRELGGSLEREGTPTLWLYALWAAHVGEADEVERARALAAQRASDLGSDPGRQAQARRDLLIAEILSAWHLLARADTLQALEAFGRLEPTGPRNALLWDPWESLGAERTKLAELLLAQDDYESAFHTAQWLDHPHPVSYHAFRPRSLEIRVEAARNLGQTELAEELRSRLQALRFE